jgi:hypothetical protein
MKRYISVLFLLASILFGVSHAFAQSENLRAEEVKEGAVKGVFTLILYGARDINDIETLVLLDIEGDQYTLEPYAPAFDYKIKKGIITFFGVCFGVWRGLIYVSSLSSVPDEFGSIPSSVQKSHRVSLSYWGYSVLDAFGM